MLVKFIAGHDFNIPAAKLAGQTHVLTPSANRQRKLIFANQRDGPPHHGAQNHLLHLGRLQCVGDEHLRILTPAHDVDPLSRQFVDDVLDSISPDADTSPDTIDPLVGAADRDLAAIAGLAGHRLYADHAFGNFGNFLFEQPHHQMGSCPTKEHFDTTTLFTHFENCGANSLVGMVRFSGDLFTARQDRFDITQRHGGGAALVSLHNAAEHLTDHLVVFSIQGVSFRLANLLDDDLLGSLRANSPDRFFRVKRRTVMGPANRTVVAVDVDFDFRFVAIVLLGGRNERRFDRLKDDLFVNLLVAMDRVNNPQQLARVHDSFAFVNKYPNRLS